MKTAVVVFARPAFWISIRSISDNLTRAYIRAFGKQNVRVFSWSADPVDAWRAAEELKNWNPSRIAFIGMAVPPVWLLRALHDQYSGKIPPLYLHVYGDFSLQPHYWTECEEILKTTRSTFVCASDRQSELVRGFLPGSSKNIVQTCPFPVDDAVFHYDPSRGKAWRRKLKLRDDELNVLYAGRISLQKNPHGLAQELSSYEKKTGRRVRLLIAGGLDDLAIERLGIASVPGRYFKLWSELLGKLPEKFRERVTFLGNLKPKELADAYNACDVFASLSVTHDEDFGMAPAEALCSGSPAILADWGGYASLAEPDVTGNCKLVPVSITNRGLALENGSLGLHLAALAPTSRRAERRSAISHTYRNRYSISAVAEALKKLHRQRPPTPFPGFGKTMRRYLKQFQTGTLYPQGPIRGTFYEEIYRTYVRRGKNS